MTKPAQNAWLVLQGHEIIEKRKEVGIDVEKGTKVQVTVFPNHEIHWDPDFGFFAASC